MEKIRYLYGASVQGIQSFIFQTNDLKSIVGASELVEQICTKMFEHFAKEEELVVNAAGNIKCIFANKQDCAKAVLEFPKEVQTKAPGITISQAVVKMKEGDTFGTSVDKLECRLRIQRNKPSKSLTIGYMGTRRSRKTGLPAVDVDKEGYLDESTLSKQKNSRPDKENSTLSLSIKNFGINQLTNSQICYDIDDMTDRNNWIAVIHADGNGLGQVVRKIGKEGEKYHEFSANLNKATERAAQKAFISVCEKHGVDMTKKIPFRPVVLSGDDHTIICRADLALDYATIYLREFENQTYQLLGNLIVGGQVFTKGDMKDRLSACAGISYIKASYPFYYGYKLAESLCALAKKDAKREQDVKEGHKLPKSCLMFYKVQDSFIEDFSKIAERELTPSQGDSFVAGPYYLSEDHSSTGEEYSSQEGRWTVKKLLDNVCLLDSKDGNAVKSDLRQWLSLMYVNSGMAQQKKRRMLFLNKKNSRLSEVIEEATKGLDRNDDLKRYPAYDILALHSIFAVLKKRETR